MSWTSSQSWYGRSVTSGSGPTSGSPGFFARPCATSIRKPSTPRSSQNRRMSSNSARTSGCSQFRSGCSGANMCRYQGPALPSASVTRVQALPPK